MKLNFVSELPPDRTGCFTSYQGNRGAPEGWEFHDLTSHIRKNQDAWFDALGRWHGELSRIASEATPWWWLLPLSRVLAFDPPLCRHLLCALGIVKLCESLRSEELYLTGFPKAVARYVADFHPDFLIEFQKQRRETPGRRREFPFLRSLKRSLDLAARWIGIFGRLCANSFRAPSLPVQAKVLAFSHFLGFESFRATGDHFFHDLLDNLPGFGREDVVWFFLQNSNQASGTKHLKKWMREKGIPCATLLDLLTLSDVVRVCLHYGWMLFRLRAVRSKIPPLSICGYRSRFFVFDYFETAVRPFPPFMEFGAYFAARRLLKRLKTDTVLYPYEGKGVERALLKARHEEAPETRCIAYAHALYNPGLLYVRFHHEDLVGPLKPDLIACTGPRMSQWLQTWGRTNPDRIAVIGSSRYCDPLPLPIRRSSLRILILGGLAHELDRLADFLNDDHQLFENCQVTVRTYPYSWQEEQNDSIGRLRRLCSGLREDSAPLKDQLHECDVAVMSATSAGIEAMLSGRPVISLDLHGLINLDPLEGKGDLSAIPRCSSPRDLKKALDRIRMMSDAEYASLVQGQINLAREIFAPPERNMTANLLADITGISCKSVLAGVL